MTDVPLSSVLGLDSKEPPFSSLAINFGNEVFHDEASTEVLESRVHLGHCHPFVRKCCACLLFCTKHGIVGHLLVHDLHCLNERRNIIATRILWPVIKIIKLVLV